MDDASSMDVAERTEHATKVSFDASHRKLAIVVLRRHDSTPVLAEHKIG